MIGQEAANFLSSLWPDERKYILQNISFLMRLNQSPAQSRIAFAKAKLLKGIFTPPHEKEKEKN